jgi:hypothetical protein
LGPSQRPGHGGDRMDIFAVPQADSAAASIASALGSVSGRRAQKCQEPDTLMKHPPVEMQKSIPDNTLGNCLGSADFEWNRGSIDHRVWYPTC